MLSIYIKHIENPLKWLELGLSRGQVDCQKEKNYSLLIHYFHLSSERILLVKRDLFARRFAPIFICVQRFLTVFLRKQTFGLGRRQKRSGRVIATEAFRVDQHCI